MRKTSIRVLFEIFGDDFPVEKITEILNIKPSSISRKGEKINDVAYKKETAWSIDTGEIESLDLNDQIQQILVLIKDKEEQLLEIKKDYSVSFLISIVISIRDHYCPSIFFDEHLINFINKIGAEISIDLYD